MDSNDKEKENPSGKISVNIPEEKEEEKPAARVSGKIPGENSPLSDCQKIVEKQFYREVIEALRLGGVPQEKIFDFTCGREDELNKIADWLSDSRGSIAIVGEYGSGKSHLINIIAEKALLNNRAVAKVEIDPRENAFNRPRNIYASITESFTYHCNDDVKHFDDLLENILSNREDPDYSILYENEFFKGFLRYCDIYEYNESINEWMRGKQETLPGAGYILPKMMDTQVSANIYSYLISTLGWICKNLLKLDGLLILFDEAEGIDPGYYSGYQYQQSENMIGGLIKMSNSEPVLKTEELNNYIGTETGLKYCGQNRQQYPFLWMDKSHVKLLFSFVPGMIDSLSDESPLTAEVKKLEPILIIDLDIYERAELLKKIVDAYTKAYGFKTAYNPNEGLPTEKTRIFVKSIVEALDLLRFHPKKDPEEFLKRYDFFG
ncbi:ATP-binding protein [Methanoplanus endosymbiosus]|uniref:ATP-binding protein n=1 Tax=Methanoplanus endosymbiosus TaxID=33865 RepID=A0A9E7TIK7_9EURY|nr:ATP-binding protein [Methanoplanus endosymbiosus]UUX92638.1 ATP-binding protein [Methanoplanus endosymbiosus]